MLTVAMLVYAVTPEIAEMTKRNVATLLANTTGEFELRVLFNGGPAVALPADDRLVPIYMAERSSIAHAYNLAFSSVRGDVFACVHNDVSVPYGWNEKLAAAVGDGFAFPTPVEDAQECAQRGIRPLENHFPTGCCFMFSRALWEDLEGFDEQFEDCHFEDTDLWMRGVIAGRRLTRADLLVEHGRGKTRTELPDTGNVSFRRNKERYIAKHAKPDGRVTIPLLQEQPHVLH